MSTMGTPSNPHSPQGLFVGLSTVDLTYSVEEIPGPNQKISVAGQLITPGGPANNAAITFAFLGGRSTLVTSVGKHLLAAVIRDDLQRFSVGFRDLAAGRWEAPPVSSILVLRPTGERTVVSANAAVFSQVTEAEFKTRWLKDSSIIQVDGHYMPVCVAAARAGRDRGITVVLDSGSWKPGMDELLTLVDTAIC